MENKIERMELEIRVQIEEAQEDLRKKQESIDVLIQGARPLMVRENIECWFASYDRLLDQLQNLYHQLYTLRKLKRL